MNKLLVPVLLFPAAIQAGVVNSKHDLSSDNGNQFVGGTTEVCVFCHTPHGSNLTVAAPLWNKSKPSTTFSTYTTSNSTTIDNEVLEVGSVSLACLSCHDGSQAMDVAMNAPGTGAGDGTISDGSVQMTGFAAIGAGGDLKNDHPVGIQYGVVADGDFKETSSTTIDTVSVYWVETGSNSTRDKTDIILYNRAFDSGIQASVECASCHDPHNDSTANATAGLESVAFLRMSNTGSALCLACHTK